MPIISSFLTYWYSTWTIYKAFHENCYHKDTFPFHFNNISYILDIAADITVRKMELYIMVFIIIIYIWFLPSFDSILRCWGIPRHYNIFKISLWLFCWAQCGYPQNKNQDDTPVKGEEIKAQPSGKWTQDISPHKDWQSVHCFRGFRISEFPKGQKRNTI